MTIAIVVVVLLGYVFMASEHFTHVNKALVAMFCGTVGWILFMCPGPDFIDVLHAQEFRDYLATYPDGEYTLWRSKLFTNSYIFMPYVAQIGSMALYLLATMSIVVVLVNNECFSFIETLLRRRSTAQVLWLTVLVTFALSTCIDNLTVTVMMLMIMRKILRNSKQRMYIGSAILISATCGGCWTVIGDVTNLMIWTQGAVTPTNFSLSLGLSAIVGVLIPTFLIQRNLPEHLDLERAAYNYRGDDSLLEWWQKCILLFWGIAGLWFIPSFNRITALPPFLGALCCVGVMWVANELINIKRFNSQQPMTVSFGRDLQYEVIQVIMYCAGVCLCVDVLIEIGAMREAADWCDTYLGNFYAFGALTGFISAVLDNFALVMAGISIHEVAAEAVGNVYRDSFVMDGSYWHVIALSGSIAGCLLPIGSISGLAFMKAENVKMWWYFRRISLFVLIAWIASLATYFLVDFFIRGSFVGIDY